MNFRLHNTIILLSAKRSAFHNNYWDDIMRGTPGFRFHDNENSLYDRDIMHKRTEGEHKEEETAFREEEGDSKEEKNNVEEEVAAPHKETLGTWEDWSDFDTNFDGFTSLMEDASLYPPNFGSSLTILTRVQKKDGKGNASEEEDKSVEKRQGSSKTINDNNEKNAEGKEAEKEKKSLQAVAPASSDQGGARQVRIKLPYRVNINSSWNISKFYRLTSLHFLSLIFTLYL